MSLSLSNPEFIRNVRIQMRRGRCIAAAIICAVISLTIWASIAHAETTVTMDGLSGIGAVFALVLNIQIGILLIGGGIYTLQSVHREKDLNTFDFQRVTRLTSLELAIGKLFGAPIGAYFVVLCFMPVALIAATSAHVSPLVVCEAYLILLLGSIAYHSFALLISVLLGRGGSVWGILFYLTIVGLAAYPAVYEFWSIHNVSPFFAGDLVDPTNAIKTFASRHYWRDAFFGQTIPHIGVLLVLYVTLIGWFMLATHRNLKRDPSEYEVFSHTQAFCFVLYLSFLMIGFFPWTTIFLQGPFTVGQFTVMRKPAAPYEIEQELLQAAILFLGILALLLLRNRERVRLRVRNFRAGAAGLWAAIWPVPYLCAAAAIIGGAIVGLVDHYRNVGSDWSWQLALYSVAFLAVWLSRDALYLQWMNVRRTKRPLLSAVLYLTVFYGCTGVIFSVLSLYNAPRESAATAVLMPSPLYALTPQSWNQQHAVWIVALVLQALTASLFVCLHWLRLREFPDSAPETATPVTQST